MRDEYKARHVLGRVLVDRLAAYFKDPEVSAKWHAVMDLLVVQYHSAIGDTTDEVFNENAAPGHSGLTSYQLRKPDIVEDRYQGAFATVLLLVKTRPVILVENKRRLALRSPVYRR